MAAKTKVHGPQYQNFPKTFSIDVLMSYDLGFLKKTFPIRILDSFLCIS